MRILKSALLALLELGEEVEVYWGRWWWARFDVETG